MFRVSFHPVAHKEFLKMEDGDRGRMRVQLLRLRSNPEKLVKRLVGSRFFRVRSGDYRAIVEIDREEEMVVVLYVGHRSTVYPEFRRFLE